MKTTKALYALLVLATLGLSLSSCRGDDDDELVDGPPRELCGRIEEDMTLENWNTGVDYVVNCDLEVWYGVITVEPGVTIEVMDGYYIQVDRDGGFNAVGTAEEPILIQGRDNAGIPSWKGIEIFSASTRNNFTYCTIADAGNDFGGNAFFDEQDAAIYVGGKLTMVQSTVTNSGSCGIYFAYRDPYAADIVEFRDNSFTANEDYPIVIEEQLVEEVGDNFGDFTFSANGNDMIYVYAQGFNGSINGHTWYPASTPYFISDNVQIDGGFTLKAGIDMVFRDGVGIYTWNTSSDYTTKYIKIEGTVANPVVMRGESDVPGAWEGLGYTTDNVNNVVEYLEISNAESSDYGSAVWVQNEVNHDCSLTMNNSTINNATCGVFEGLNSVVSLTDNTYNSVTNNTCN